MRNYVLLSLCLFSLLFSGFIQAQTYCTKANKDLCESQLNKLKAMDTEQKIQDIAVQVGKNFLGTPYLGGTLEVGEQEQLVIELQGLDCTTFMENVVVFSRLAKKESLDFESFQKELEYLRYRDGQMHSYSSRLHYFTEWISNNEAKGIVKDVTAEIGGEPYNKQINFMSTHRSSYKQLASDEYFKDIQKIEGKLNQNQRYYIPKAKLASLESGIQSGDLVTITTTIKGLDVSHVGMAYRKNGRVHMLHAS
ncbi:MAG: N-acetylmuramoyl-L-alanine amidase-like domain-containing protein, partial [Bacteroidota bacterium]